MPEDDVTTPQQPEDPAHLLYQFTGNAAGALQRVGRLAEDLQVASTLLAEASRLQGIVRQFNQQIAQAETAIALLREQNVEVQQVSEEMETRRDAAYEACRDAEELLRRERQKVHERIGADLDEWVILQKQARLEAMEQELTGDLARISAVSAEKDALVDVVQSLETQKRELEREIAVFRQAKAQLLQELSEE